MNALIGSNQSSMYVLGLDLGANSLGWSAIRVEGGQPCGILASGVRVFESAVQGLEQGRDETANAKRRNARLARRQTDRRRRRIHKIYRILAKAGLLPDEKDLHGRIRAIAEIDKKLAAESGRHDGLPYWLRAQALDRKLEPLELGRALFHLAQRRGFQSNRKATAKEEERGKVKAGITELGSLMQEAGARTLGEFLASLDPHQVRIRGRYTSRKMYVDEFEAIWNAQQPHHPAILTTELRSRLWQAMFFQRPLDDQSDLIGQCELEPSEKRAPMWHPLVQRFRLLQGLNNLRLIDEMGVAAPLSPEDRAAVLERLEAGDLGWKEFKKLLGIKRGVQINLEAGGNKGLIGDRTEQKMRAAFQQHWDRLSPQEKLEAIEDVAGGLDDEALRAKAEQRWGLNAIQAEAYSEISLETGKYAAFSLRAIERLLPYLECGDDVTTARRKAYPETFATGQPLDLLPPADSILTEIRNPAVLRALSQLRKVVNAIIRKYGKPEEIHLELARDLKASRLERENRWKRMRAREKEREEAFKHISGEVGIPKPSREDIEKWLLACECNWQCPYSGRSFSKYQLFHSGEVQVEHIIPFSRSLDDSYANKTLAYADINTLKGNQTPKEAFGATPEWDDIVGRFKAFKSDFVRVKLRRVQMDTDEVDRLLQDFTQRQLNDTRYASRLAARYVATLYGGLSDAEGRQRIFVSPGQVTAYLRRLWSLEGLLGKGEGKGRDDHRHHAIDATVVALTGPASVKALADAAQRAQQVGRRRFASLAAPWDGLVSEMRAQLERMIPSRLVRRRVRGALHDETLYGRIESPEKGRTVTVVRKPVHRLSPSEVDAIVDPVVRNCVQSQIQALGGDAKRLEGSWPVLRTKTGREIPIRKVRIELAEEPRAISQGLRSRLVVGGEYHHFEIFRFWNAKKKQWAIDFEPVSIHQAYERVKAKQPVVSRDHGPDTEFLCSVAKNELFEMGDENGGRRLLVVRTLEATTGQIGFQDVYDARPYSAANKNRQRIAVAVVFGKLGARKLGITPLGELLPAND